MPLPRTPARTAAAIRLLALLFASLLPACERRPVETAAGVAAEPVAADDAADQPPVALNPDAPVAYPEALLEERVEGKVVLHLFIDEEGIVVPDSTRIAESSGVAALDSAALAAAGRFDFAPALRGGEPVATAFLQPIYFRAPQAEPQP